MFDFFKKIKYEVRLSIKVKKRKVRQFFCNHHFVSRKVRNMFGEIVNGIPECEKCGIEMIDLKPWYDIEYK